MCIRDRVSSDVVNEKRVLVLCAGGGTSGLLANACLLYTSFLLLELDYHVLLVLGL